MSSKSLKRLSKTIGFRLAVWYSAILAVSFMILCILAYSYLWHWFREYDRETIQAELNECVVQFQSFGVKGLQNEVAMEQHLGKDGFFIHLMGPHKETVFLNVSEVWKRYDLAQATRSHVNADKALFNLQIGDDELEVSSLRFGDGYVMQVGKNTMARRAVLGRFYADAALLIVLMIVMSFVGGLFLASRTLQPLRSLIVTLQSIIETGRMDLRAPKSHTRDELDTLATLFNILLEKIRLLIAGLQEALDNIAHDLRTPLTRLRGMAELALSSDQNQEVLREALADSLEESKRMVAMLNTLLDISEADTGVMKLNLDSVDICPLLEEAVELYRFVAEERDISIRTTCDQGLYVTVDPIRLRQVLANLLDNALKYTPPGGGVDLEARQEQGEIVITIRDTGMGIQPADLPKIWNRLYRGDGSRSQRGLGLGLSLVKAIVHAHRGKVDCLSEPGIGSIFSIYLPKKS